MRVFGFVLMALALTAYCVREFWVLYDFREEIFYPYPLAPKQYNYVETFWSMLCAYAFLSLFSLILWLGIKTNKVFWFCVFALSVSELIEYRLNYNIDWCMVNFGLFDVPISITTIRFLVLFLAFIYELKIYGRHDRTVS